MIEEPYIITYTGRKVHPLHATPDEICVEDIAHALANKCRFSGHVQQFYSVAQHSVIVANFYTLDPLWGLLHDAAEAYLPDVASPLKACLPSLRYAEQRLMEVVADKFGLGALNDAEEQTLKQVDLSALLLEWDALMVDPEGYGPGFDRTKVPQMHWNLQGAWVPVEAERVFLKTYGELK